MRSGQQPPDGDQMPVTLRQRQREQDQRLDQNARAIRPVRVAVIADDQRIGDKRSIVLHVGMPRIQFIERIEAARRRDAALAEGIEHHHLLTLLPPRPRGDARELALGIDGQHRTVIEQQVRHDERDALAAARPGNRQHMAIVERADAAAIPVAKHQPADLTRCGAVLPFGTGELCGFEPHRIDQRTRLPRHAAQQLRLQPLLEVAHAPSPCLPEFPCPLAAQTHPPLWFAAMADASHQEASIYFLDGFVAAPFSSSSMPMSVIAASRCCLACLTSPHLTRTRAPPAYAVVAARASTAKWLDPPRLCACAPRDKHGGPAPGGLSKPPSSTNSRSPSNFTV